MEHIRVVQSHLMNFLESNAILSNFQYGFWNRRSCETQRITIIKDLSIGLDRRQQVDTLLLDFSKASDKVSYHRWQSSSLTMAAETRAYPGSKVSLQIGINKLSFMGGHLLLQLWVSFAPDFQCCYFCESSCLFYLSFNSNFCV